jgi:hypothetical protein
MTNFLVYKLPQLRNKTFFLACDDFSPDITQWRQKQMVISKRAMYVPHMYTKNVLFCKNHTHKDRQIYRTDNLGSSTSNLSIQLVNKPIHPKC